MDSIHHIIFEHQQKSQQNYKQQKSPRSALNKKRSKVEELLGAEFSADLNYQEVKKKDKECSLYSFIMDTDAL